MASHYEVETKFFKNLDKNISLPNYQRNLVWSKKQKESFVDNISRGFPFGSILLFRYPDSKDNKYSLIDGLQRWNTLRDYDKNPSKYFTKIDKFVDRLYDLLKQLDELKFNQGKEKKDKNILRIELGKMLQSTNKCEDIEYLPNQISKVFLLNIESIQLKIAKIQNDLVNESRTFIDLDKIAIPCIIFIGDEEQLPDVFANLNQGGSKLSKYQVLAAQWNRHSITIPESKLGNNVLDKVIGRYRNLIEKRDFLIDNFDEESILHTRDINLSELCYALGEIIVDEVPVFWSRENNNINEDTINVVGYLSLAIALNVDVRHISLLADKVVLLKEENFTKVLLENIVKEYSVINNLFSGWLRYPGTSATKYENKVITDFQVLSYFASLWHSRYQVDEDTKQIYVIPSYKARGYNKIMSNLVPHSVMDVVHNVWSGSGDSTLARYYIPGENNIDYLMSYEEKDLYDNLLIWYNDISRRGSKNLEKVSKFLLCLIFSQQRNKFTAETYDIEHIIVKKLLEKPVEHNLQIYEKENIPGGCLGNITYLSSSLNKAKKDLNLYKFRDKYDGMELGQDFLDLISYPYEEEINDAEKALLNNDALRANYLINKRADSLLKNLAELLAAIH